MSSIQSLQARIDRIAAHVDTRATSAPLPLHLLTEDEQDQLQALLASIDDKDLCDVTDQQLDQLEYWSVRLQALQGSITP